MVAEPLRLEAYLLPKEMRQRRMTRRIGLSTKAFEKRSSYVSWVDGKPILIVKHAGTYYAMDAVCAHRGCVVLTDVEGFTVTCPAHGAVYDIRTGELNEKPQVHPEAPCEYSESKTPLATYWIRETPEGSLEIDL